MTKLIHVGSELEGDSGVLRAFVPTMGSLHQGHLDLVDAARAAVGPDGEVVMSIFVNPTQFGSAADVSEYPQSLESDFAKCEASGVDVVFAPSVNDMFPEGTNSRQNISVQPGPLGSVLEGADRPGHFAGVLTVVAKLFNLTRPSVTFFGEKDYQQLMLISQMVRQLNIPVTVIGVQSRRESDGLAMSSRNVFLNPAQRLEAASISRALFAAQDVQGNVNAQLAAARAVLSGDIQTSYLVAMSGDLSRELAGADIDPDGRLLFAGVLGSTRLIDNVPSAKGKTP